MAWILSVLLLIIAGTLLYLAGELLVSGLLRLSRYFRAQEFVVAFFVMAVAATMPNFFVGFTSALQGIPELSFGDIMGNNMVALTLGVALAVFFSPKKELPIGNHTVRGTTFLTAIAAFLPLALITDGVLSRFDGVILISFFALYVIWLFSRKDRFSKVYDEKRALSLKEGRIGAIKAIAKVIVGLILLAVSAQVVVQAAVMAAEGLQIPLILIGVLVIGFGGALPELYFTVISARKGETDMLLGNLMGAVIIPATLVLGMVALIQPIYNENLELPLIGRILLATVALFFLYLSRTKQLISRNEGALLVLIYFVFIVAMLLL
ncbi:MAG: hypothetical protein WD605_00625 [Candidatus Paceibacterota bacterium]